MAANGVTAGSVSPIKIRVCGTMHLKNKTKTLLGLYSNWGRSDTRTLLQALLDQGPKHPQTSVVLNRHPATLLQHSLSPRHELPRLHIGQLPRKDLTSTCPSLSSSLAFIRLKDTVNYYFIPTAYLFPSIASCTLPSISLLACVTVTH